MLRIASVLDDATEALLTRIIGLCITVHRGLGPGLLESIYGRAICLELGTAGLSFEVEKQVPVLYKGIVLCHHRLDIVVEGKALLEIKVVDKLAPIHYAQVLSYLRISQLPVALLMNFNSVVLPDGLKRIVL